MRQNKQDAKQIFWKPRELEGGLIEVIVPYGTVIEPDARKRYAHRWGSYHTKDPRFGGDAYVYEDTDYDLGMRVKRVYMNVPLETMAICCGNDGIEFKGQRDQDDHRDKRPLEGWEDENGNWHYGAESEAATLDEYFAGQEDAHISQNDAEKPEYPTEVPHGPLSDDYRIRSAQVKYMCGIVERAMEARSETLQRTFLALFHQRMQGVDYAEKEGVGESAITAFNRTPELREELIRMQERLQWGQMDRLNEEIAAVDARKAELENTISEYASSGVLDNHMIYLYGDGAENVEAAIEGIRVEMENLACMKMELLMQKGELAMREAQIHSLLRLTEAIEKKDTPSSQEEEETEQDPSCTTLEDFYQRTDEIDVRGRIRKYDKRLVRRFIERVEVKPESLVIYFKAGVSVEVAG